MKKYFVWFFCIFICINLSGQTIYSGESFDLPDAIFPFVTNDNQYKASNYVRLSQGFQALPSGQNKFKASIDLDIINDVSIQSAHTNSEIQRNTSTIDPNKAIGTIEGSHSIDNSGAFNYTIPIIVPSGSNGFEPSIAINYSSNAAMGIMGNGWNLIGLSSVNRTSKNEYYDGVSQAVQLNNTDPFAIDGQRLILDGSFYKTESETFERLSKINDNSTLGPESWMKESKTGLKSYYGLDNNSRVLHNSKRISWLISKIEDLNGNFIEFKYRVEDGQNLIDEILYTGNGTNAPYNKIKLTYVRKDHDSFRYFAGLEVKNNYLIDRIITFTHDAPIHEYSMSYAHQSEGYLSGSPQLVHKIEILNEIRLKSLIDGKEYHSTAFNYLNSSAGKALGPFALNSLASTTTPSIYLTSDYNNDGLTDISQFITDFTGNINSLKFWQNNTPTFGATYYKGFSNTSNLNLSAFPSANRLDLNKYWDAFSRAVRSTDLDGDGKDDILFSYASSGNTQLRMISDYSMIPTNQITLNTTVPAEYDIISGDISGDGTSEIIALHREEVAGAPALRIMQIRDVVNSTNYSINFSVPNGFGLAYSYDNIETIDFDGDGTIEFLFWEFSNQSGHIAYTVADIIKTGNGYQLVNLGSPFVFPNHYNQIRVADLNNDGISDFLLTRYVNGTYPTGSSILLGKGSLDYNVINPSIDFIPSTDKIFLIDINGDRLADIVRLYKINNLNNSTGIRVYFSSGSEFSLQEFTPLGYGLHKLSNFSFGDFDGNNSLELFYLRDESNPSISFFKQTPYYYVLHGGPKTLKLHGIVDGLYRQLYVDYVYNSEPEAVASSTYNNNLQNIGSDIYTLNKQILLTKSIRSQLGHWNSPQAPYINHSEILHYATALYEKTGRGLLGFKSKATINPINNFTTESINEYYANCTCLLPETLKVLHPDVPQGSDPIQDPAGLASIELKNHQVISKSNGRNLILETSSNYNNKINGKSLSTTNSYIISGNREGNLFTQIVDDGVYQTTTQYNSYVALSTYMNIFPMEIVVSKSKTGSTNNFTTTTSFDRDLYGRVKNIRTLSSTNKQVTNSYTYDNYGNIVTSTRSSSGLPTLTSVYEFDDFGRLLESEVNAKGQKIEYVNHQLIAKPLTIADLNDNQVYFEYDGFGRKISEIDPLGNKTFYNLEYTGSGFHSLNNLYYSETIIPGNPKTKKFYDNLNRIIRTETESWNGETTYQDLRYEIDNSLLSYKTIPQFISNMNAPLQIDYSYDSYERLEQISHPLSGNTDYEYSLTSDGFEEMTTFNNSTFSVTTNSAGEKVKSMDPGGLIDYLYNAQGLPTQIKIGSNVVSTMSYDPIDGTQTQLIDANSGSIDYVYNAYGQLTQQTDAKGSTTQNYNQYGELTDITSPLGSIQYSYVQSGGGVNQVETISNYDGSQEEFKYDRFSRLSEYSKTINGIKYLFRYEYDNFGRKSKLIYPSGFGIKYEYSPEGYLEIVRSISNNSILWQGNSVNDKMQFTSTTKGDGLTTSYSYDASGLPDVFGGKISLDYDFDANDNGNLSKLMNLATSNYQDFDYDNLDRLTEVMTNDVVATIEEIQYSANGNIKRKGPLTNYSYHPSKINAITSLQNSDNSIPVSEQNISYNAFHQPSSIIEDIYELQLTYDPEGNRSSSTLFENGIEKRKRIYLGNYEIQEFPQDNRKQEIHYISGGNGLAAICVIEDGNEEIYYTYSDYLGSILTITDGLGNTVFEQSFDVWGRRRNPSNWSYSGLNQSPDWLYRGYTGHEHYEEFGLINMNGRMYDPAVGRMLSPDNFVQDPNSTQSYNRYSYVNNNPLKYYDPSGELRVSIKNPLGFMNDANFLNAFNTFHNIAMTAGIIVGSTATGGYVGGVVSAATGSGSIIGGILVGGAAGFSVGFTRSFASSIHSGGDLNSSFRKGINSGLKGAAIGGGLGGISGGIHAYKHGGNLLTGKGNTYYSLATETSSSVAGTPENYTDEYLNKFSEEKFKTISALKKQATLHASKGPYAKFDADGYLEVTNSKAGHFGQKAMAYSVSKGFGRGYDIFFSKAAVASWQKLYLTMGHEYLHVAYWTMGDYYQLMNEQIHGSIYNWELQQAREFNLAGGIRSKYNTYKSHHNSKNDDLWKKLIPVRSFKDFSR